MEWAQVPSSARVPNRFFSVECYSLPVPINSTKNITVFNTRRLYVIYHTITVNKVCIPGFEKGEGVSETATVSVVRGSVTVTDTATVARLLQTM